MPNFETMRALRWKLDQAHIKATPKTFLRSLKGGEFVQESWAGDVVLYFLFMVVVIAFVWIVVKFAKDFKSV